MAKKREKKEAVVDRSMQDAYGEWMSVSTWLTDAQSVDNDQRQQAREAHLFVTKRDGQWEPYWWHRNAGKPRYTFDITSDIVNQIVSEIQESSFDIRVQPAGGDATKDIALTYDGLIRNIENISNASVIYSQAANGMVVSGLDGWRVVQQYVDGDSFDQDLMIEKIPNFLDRVWFDPSASLPDKSDSRYVYVLHPVSTEEYLARWPEGSETSVSMDLDSEAYYDKEEVIVCGEFLYRKPTDQELVLMSNGKTYVVDDKFEKIRDELAGLQVVELKRRKRTTFQWCSRMFDGADWLEDARPTVFNKCPIIPVYANYVIIENKTTYSGAVEKMLDPQRVLNYSLSREIEEGALAPRAKYWMTEKQAEGYEESLSTLNTNSEPVQFYNPDIEAPGAPMQTGGAQINQGLSRISETMQIMLGKAAGMFAPSMGDNPGLQSGIAIEQLQNKGDKGTVKYFKAMEIAIAATARVLIPAIPKMYDTQRVVRVLYEDDTYDMVALNEQVLDRQTGEYITLNDLSQGTYDVVCTAGPAFQNRQTETMEALLKIAQVDPSIIQLGGDILLNNIPTPAAKQLAERRRAQMIQQGLIPEDQMTDEEKEQQAANAQAQQQVQDPAMVLAQAEMVKAQADMQTAQIKAADMQYKLLTLQFEREKFMMDHDVDMKHVEIDAFTAQTNRAAAMVKAEQAGVEIEKQTVSITGAELDNALKAKSLMTPAQSTNGEMR